MNLCDSNVWLALTLSDHVHHPVALQWLDGVSERRSVLLCRATQQSLLRLLTSAAVMAPYGNPPLANREAWDVYGAFAADDRITLWAQEPPGLESRWRALAARETASPKLWMDAYLAAFAMASGATMVTTDTAFEQFAGLDLTVLRS